MKKLTIPAILAATVMVAGIFAFMPVEQASTVHTSGTITLATGSINADSVADNALDAEAFATGAFDAAAFATNAIGLSELADDAIANDAFTADAITDDAIADDAISNDGLAANSITDDALATVVEPLNTVVSFETANLSTASGGNGVDCTATGDFVVYFIIGDAAADGNTVTITDGSGAARVLTLQTSTTVGDGIGGVNGFIGGDAGDTINIVSNGAVDAFITAIGTVSDATLGCS